MADTTTVSSGVTYKQVYRTYNYPQDDGMYYTIYWVPEFASVEQPVTDIPVPSELSDKVPMFDWQSHAWVDSNTDPVVAQLNAVQSQNKQLVTQLKAATEAAAVSQQATAALMINISVIQSKLAALTASSTTSTTVKASPTTTPSTTTSTSTTENPEQSTTEPVTNK